MPPLRRNIALCLTLAASLAAAHAPAAIGAQRIKLRPVSRSAHTARFDVRRLRDARVHSARLIARGKVSRVSSRRVAAGVRTGSLALALPGREDRSSRLWRRGTRLYVSADLGTRSTSPIENGSDDTSDDGDSQSSCLPAGRLFRVGLWPGGCWRPYSDSSPFNQRIGLDARAARSSSAMVRDVTSRGEPGNLLAGMSGSEDDWDHPTYYSLPSDPVFTLHCYEEDWGTCNIEGHRVRIPDRARPAAGGDGHLAVVDQASGWEYDLYKVRSKPRGGGRLSLRWGGRTRIDGDGLGSDATAARFGNLAGIIRAQELEAGEIRHALFMTTPCGNDDYVYPAMKEGATCGGRNAPPMGSHFQLTLSDSQINALNVPRWKKTIMRAMAHYGMYFGDTGGDTWTVQLESGQTYTSFGRTDEMVKFAKRAGVPEYNGHYSFRLAGGLNWARHLRVVDPCVARRSC
jgi:hypothetical protein